MKILSVVLAIFFIFSSHLTAETENKNGCSDVVQSFENELAREGIAEIFCFDKKFCDIEDSQISPCALKMINCPEKCTYIPLGEVSINGVIYTNIKEWLRLEISDMVLRILSKIPPTSLQKELLLKMPTELRKSFNYDITVNGVTLSANEYSIYFSFFVTKGFIELFHTYSKENNIIINEQIKKRLQDLKNIADTTERAILLEINDRANTHQKHLTKKIKDILL